MSQIKITDPALAGYTGHLGTVEFKDGISVGAVSNAEAERIAAAIRVEITSGDFVPVAQRMLDVKAERAEATEPLPRGMTEEEIAADQQPATRVDQLPSKLWSEDELIEIADKSGINGLREIGDTLGVKGRAIPDLIKAILKAQG